MKINYKKIIAREFLFLISSLIISLIFVLIANYKYDSYIENIDELNKLTVTDSLPKRLKIYEITSDIDSENKFPEYIAEVSKLTGFPNKKVFIEKLKDEKIANLFYENANAYFEIKNDKKTFLKKIKSDKNESESRIEKISEIENKINQYETSIKFDQELIIILFTLTFLIRYLYYSTRWSIKQLKEKEDN